MIVPLRQHDKALVTAQPIASRKRHQKGVRKFGNSDWLPLIVLREATSHPHGVAVNASTAPKCFLLFCNVLFALFPLGQERSTLYYLER
jgi:hypothetical protein